MMMIYYDDARWDIDDDFDDGWWCIKMKDGDDTWWWMIMDNWFLRLSHELLLGSW